MLGGHLGGDYVSGAALRPGEVKGTIISGYPCPQRVVLIALSDQYPDIRAHRGFST